MQQGGPPEGGPPYWLVLGDQGSVTKVGVPAHATAAGVVPNAVVGAPVFRPPAPLSYQK